eukprot:CAMPEP_0206439668 /NCGR_PEP_ID=MMETSP0324_2-20121206/12340_1 /ASSEMBLY_ACC=CAM_ASM_000836 /TAXON_ID=2866 /ORGANISM="Crypthecodinium cohnii, Strain Seligo" /LENGTH=123 /DNA_ID=CAMNT_0053907317 /DNA_START=217 /DNA_END=588 /DNA_ORIENTATION=+
MWCDEDDNGSDDDGGEERETRGGTSPKRALLKSPVEVDCVILPRRKIRLEGKTKFRPRSLSFSPEERETWYLFKNTGGVKLGNGTGRGCLDAGMPLLDCQNNPPEARLASKQAEAEDRRENGK